MIWLVLFLIMIESISGFIYPVFFVAIVVLYMAFLRLSQWTLKVLSLILLLASQFYFFLFK